MSGTVSELPAGDASDLHRETAEEPAPKKESKQILRHEIEEGITALERTVPGLFLSALSGGLDVGFSLFLMAIVWTRAGSPVADAGAPSLHRALLELLIGNMYAVGFIFVVLGRSELFTEQTTLAVLPVLGGRASLAKLLRLWIVVYVGNIFGAAGFAAVAVLAGPALGVIDPHAFGDIARRLIDHTSWEMCLSGILAGWLMGLLSWLVAAGRDTISQIVLVWLITTVIGFANLHHVVLGSVEVLAGVFSNQGVTAWDYGHFLMWVTLGNVLGGSIFVALIKYGHARPDNS